MSRGAGGAVRQVAKSGLLLLAALAVILVIGEIALRLWQGVPLGSVRSFRAEAVTRGALGGMAAEYDSLLGWRMRSNIPGSGFGTLAYGIRRNSASETSVRAGGMLVMGDSFASGAEVMDDASWPAALERRTGVPVLNAAVGGYGVDQMVLRAESLLPVVHPKVLVVGMLDSAIDRTGFSSYGRPKPYFTLDGATLAAHNEPVPISAPGEGSLEPWKNLLGYSLLINYVMTRHNAAFWLGTAGQKFTRISNDQVNVTCALLRRLKRGTDKAGIRTLVVMQHGATAIADLDAPPPPTLRVERCAREIGIQIIDEFATLKAIARDDAKTFDALYIIKNGVYGHMSARGNDIVAALIAEALQAPAPVTSAAGDERAALVPGDGDNLFPLSEKAEQMVASSHFATLAAVLPRAPLRSGFRLAAIGGDPEHFVALAPLPGEPGPYTLSLELKPEGTSCLALQLLGGAKDGVLAEADLKAARLGTSPLGNGSELRGAIEPGEDGWSRLWLSAELPSGDLRVILALADAGCATRFEAGGQSVLLRALQLERGQSASAYRPEHGPGSPGFVAGDGNNLILRSEALQTLLAPLPIATLAPVPDAQSPTSLYRLAAAGPAGDHYAVVGDVPIKPGPHTVSLEVRPDTASNFRLQLLDDDHSGALGDAALDAGTLRLTEIGGARKLDGDMLCGGDGWCRITLTASLGGSHANVLLQVMRKDGSANFPATGEAVVLRALQLERGGSASPYHATGN